jgi:hypothetical protein
MRIISRILTVAAVAALTTSCGSLVRSSSSPVLLVLDFLGGSKIGGTTFTNTLASDVITLVTKPDPCTTANPCPTIFTDNGQAIMRLSPKDIGPVGLPVAPSSNNEVTITRVHVVYRRADGRNTQGVDVPFEFDGAATATVPASGTVTMQFVLVRGTAKEEAPLVQLKTNGAILTTIADVTFYGHDQVGNSISVMGSMQIDFANWGD